jgi:tRNA (guanine-N7-)-methyltransferase
MRQVQSFVRREGRLTPGQARALETLGSKFILSVQPPLLLNFETIYANSNPIILEIGFGMGQSLLSQAKSNPQNNYLGFEVHQPGVGALLAGIEREGLSNIRAVAVDVVGALSCIPDASLSGVQIFFPDPWHKKRHHKRRLIQAGFVKLLALKLQSNGFLHCATDWQDYAEHMLNAIDAAECFSKATVIPRPETRPVTKFEQRGIQLGHGVWDILASNLSGFKI